MNHRFFLSTLALTAAALCAREETGVRKCPMRRLQAKLLENGLYLGDDDRLAELGLMRELG